MDVIVSDSSVLIELSKRELLEKAFELEFQFAAPDALYHEELIDLGKYDRQYLLSLGLRVESLDSNGVRLAISYQSERRALSLVDSFALALASLRGWMILTEDRLMRRVAQCKGIVHRDTLWVIDNMLDADILSPDETLTVLKAMLDDPRCPVPKTELSIRIQTIRESTP